MKLSQVRLLVDDFPGCFLGNLFELFQSIPMEEE